MLFKCSDKVTVSRLSATEKMSSPMSSKVKFLPWLYLPITVTVGNCPANKIARSRAKLLSRSEEWLKFHFVLHQKYEYPYNFLFIHKANQARRLLTA